MLPAKAFLQALTGHDQPAVTFQTFDDRGKDKSLAHIFHGPLKTFATSLEKLNAQGSGIFLTINETDLQGRKKANVLSLRALFIDLDRPELPSFPFPPSIVVRSGLGWHVYWLLRAGEPLAAFEPAQKHLIRYYDSDPKVFDLPRVMRLPGFLWHKKDPARPIEITESHPERIYPIDEVLAGHPLPTTEEPAPKVRRLAVVPPSDHPLHERIKRASAYLAKIPAAVSGQNGHGDTWKAALTVVRGFSLPGPVALELLASEYNARCSPAWSDRELQHKVDSALNDSRVPDGYLLKTRAPRVRTLHAVPPLPAQAAAPQTASDPTEPGCPPDPAQDFMTDNTVAKRFISLQADKLRYVDVWKKWLVWKNGRWEFDEMRVVEVMARTFSKRLLIEAIDTPNGDQTRALKSAVEFQKRARIEAVVSLSRCDPRIARRAGDFDRDPWSFNCANGTIDLRTGILRPHQPEDHITKTSPVAHNPAAECQRWNQFLEEIFPDERLRAYVKRAVGYSLTASVREQVLFFAHGGGANGKSVMLGAISHIIGNYGKTAAPELLVVKSSERHETELADLAGVRLLTTIETEAGRRLAESKTKMLTGGDRIKARFLYADFFEFDPTFKVWLVSNHKPNIHGNDEGIWRRIHLIPFVVSIPKDKQDKALAEKLMAESAGILKWAVEGCLEWQRDGLQPPAAVLKAVEAYRDEMDSIGQFISERCLTGPSLYTSAKALYEAYTAWCESNGERVVSQKSLGMALKERGFDTARSEKERAWMGIAVKSTSQEGPNAHKPNNLRIPRLVS